MIDLIACMHYQILARQNCVLLRCRWSVLWRYAIAWAEAAAAEDLAAVAVMAQAATVEGATAAVEIDSVEGSFAATGA